LKERKLVLEPQVFPDHEAVSCYAADWLVEGLRDKPAAIMCLATGSTPMRTYALAAERGAKEPSLFERCRLLNLDEWGGLPADHPATCGRHLRDALVTPLGLSDRYVSFDSQPQDAEIECARIAKWLAENGPIDLCLLGLGLNGHLGFNEPDDFLQPHAHVAQLSEASLTHAMLKHGDARPMYGLTLGMADLLQSRRVMLLVTGASKCDPLKRLLSGKIATDFPASLLHLHHDAQLICDGAAG
jgi:galactosamine-6-phosphate isomerase